jgi:hypothetical protein
LFLGIGFCKSLLLLRSSLIRRWADLAFKTSLVGASLYVSISIFGYYHAVWERVVRDPQVRQACASNQPDLLGRAPSIYAHLRPHFNDIDSYDFGHPMFLSEFTRGICRVLGN